MNEILQEYEVLTQNALADWCAHPDAGTQVGLPKGYLKHSLSVGSYFSAQSPLIDFLDELESLGLPDVVLVPRRYLHFTFLGLVANIWEREDQLPSETRDAAERVRRNLHGLSWQMSSLRLVPGPGFLMLAGLPNENAARAREALVRDLMNSSWRDTLKARYLDRGYALPPRVWHTTLCRTSFQRFSEPLRSLYRKWSDRDFGALELETPSLWAPNYDWSVAWKIG